MKDPYEVLGIQRGATDDEIKESVPCQVQALAPRPEPQRPDR